MSITNTEIELYNQHIKTLETKSGFEWERIYSNHMQIFNDVFEKRNCTYKPNNEHYGVWIEINALFKYWEHNTITESINMWENLIELHDDGVYTNIDVGRVLYVLGVHCCCETEYVKALDYWLLAFGNGFVDGMLQIAEHYCEVEQNYSKAVECWELAFENGCVDAMNSMGYYYYHVVKDYDKAVECYMKAVEHGYAVSMGNLAHHYKTVGKNNVLALKYYIMGFSNGNYTLVTPMLRLVSSINPRPDFDTFYTIVEKIVTVRELGNHYDAVWSNMDSRFLQWKVLYKVERDYEESGQGHIGKRFVHIRKSLEADNFDILHFKNKFLRAVYFNTKDECVLCHDENVLNIDMECFHGVCYKCYIPNQKCFSRCVAQYRK